MTQEKKFTWEDLQKVESTAYERGFRVAADKYRKYKAHWVRTTNELGEEITICSKCGTLIKQGYLRYCAQCGAEMCEETEDRRKKE